MYGSICFAFVVVTFFMVPELKGRSLEEVDQLFAMNIPIWKFKGTRTIPVEERINHQGKEDVMEDSPKNME